MENLTTIWYYNTDVRKWIRSKDVVISSAPTKLAELRAAEPTREYMVSDRHPTRKPMPRA